MKITRVCIVLFAWIGLSSCHSFNHYELYNWGDSDVANAPHKASAAAALESASLSDEKIHSDSATGSHPSVPLETPDAKKTTLPVSCPVYRLPDLGSAPDLPYDQLDKLRKSNDPRDFDQVAEKQITMLYQYIGQIKHTIRESHQQYLKDCQSYITTNSGTQNSLGR